MGRRLPREQLLSPQTNRRADAWGGSVEKRLGSLGLVCVQVVDHSAVGAPEVPESL